MSANPGFKFGFFKGLTLNIIILGFVSLFTDLSSQMVFPLLPLFLVTTLGASALVVGLVEGTAEATASLLKVFSGYWSDRIRKRKIFVLGGYTISAIMKPLFALSYVWQSVVVIRIAERIGKGIRNAPRDAIIAESCDPNTRGKAYGLHRAMDGIGSVLGAVLAFLLFPLLGFRNIFLVAVIPAFIGVALILFVKEKKEKTRTEMMQTTKQKQTEHMEMKQKDGVLSKSKTSIKVSFKRLPPKLKFFILIATIFTLGNMGYAFLLLRAFDLGLGIDLVILLYVYFYIVYTLLIIPCGIISDKIGRKPVILAGYSIFGLVCLGLMWSSSTFEVIILFGMYGIFFALTDGVQRAFVVDMAPPDLKGTSLGTFHTAVGLAALPAGIIAGALWILISPEMTFLFGVIMSFSAVGLFLWLRPEK